MNKSKVRKFTILFFIISIFPFALGGVASVSKAKFSKSAILLPYSEKMKLIDTPQYKDINVTTIEEFDQYWKNLGNRHIFPRGTWVYLAIILVIFGGLFCFNKYSLIGLVIYSLYVIYTSLLWFSPDLRIPTAKLAGKIVLIITYVIMLIFYLNNKVKVFFFSKI